MILMGAQSGKAGDGLADGQVVHGNARLGDQLLQPRGGGIGAVPVLNIDGGGTDDDVAVNGRAHQNALAQLPGQLEHRVADEAAHLPVQQAVVAPAGGDVQLPGGDHVVQHVGIDACRVDNIPRLEVALLRVDGPALLAPGKARDLCVEPEVHTVGIGILRQSDGHIEGADNAAGRRPQGGNGVFADVGLQLVEPLGIHNFQPLHAVFHAVFIESQKPVHILLGHAYHQ